MTYVAHYATTAPSRHDIDGLRGHAVLEFGTGWCGHCRGAQPVIQQALAASPDLLHIKVEDGPGRPLGRSFRVKLWPTLIFLADGQEIARVVRPEDSVALRDALERLNAAG